MVVSSKAMIQMAKRKVLKVKNRTKRVYQKFLDTMPMRGCKECFGNEYEKLSMQSSKTMINSRPVWLVRISKEKPTTVWV
jgi:hypothetical protein